MQLLRGDCIITIGILDDRLLDLLQLYFISPQGVQISQTLGIDDRVFVLVCMCVVIIEI